MRSNTCKIENGTKDLAAILSESEKVAVYNGLNKKQSMQLRLICEELDGMLPNIVDDFEGKLWIEFEDGVCKVMVSINTPEFNADKKEELIAISKTKKNAAAVGIVGKIRNAIEDFFLDEDNTAAFDVTPGMFCSGIGFGDGVDYSYLWSLEKYREFVKQEKKDDAWDELEKSVIASVADDVTVGIKGKQIDVVIVKKFA